MKIKTILLGLLYFSILTIGNSLIDLGTGYYVTLGYMVNGGLLGYLFTNLK